MAVAAHFRFRVAVPLLASVAIFASTRATADEMRSDPRACDIDHARPRRSDPLKPRVLPFEPARPVILDGVMYLPDGPPSGATGMQGAAATPRCFAHPDVWEFGVFHRRNNPPRYY
jgi:hypothetical protein